MKTTGTKGKRTKSEKLLLKKLGERLRKSREDIGYSQEQLAYEADFSRSYYTEVETGKRNISIINLFKILAILKVEIGDIVSSNDWE